MRQIVDGNTSISLDLDALGLTLVSEENGGTPAEGFDLGFDVLDDQTTFQVDTDPLAFDSGTIEHFGTVTLGLGEAEVTIGDFSIGFDPTRVSGTASGFFVSDTLEDDLGLEVLFDIGSPDISLSDDQTTLDVGGDLLLAPELATALGLEAGIDVGDALVESVVRDPAETPVISLSFVPASETNADGSIVINEDDGRQVALRLSYDAGVIPPGGYAVAWILDVDNLFAIPGLFDGNQPAGFEDNAYRLIEPRDDENDPGGTKFVLAPLQLESDLFFSIFDDIIEDEPITLNLGLQAEEEGYEIGTSLVTVTLQDGPSATPGEGPIVDLSVSDTEVAEGEEFTVNFDVEGEIPDDGLQVFIAGGPTDLGEFNIFNEDGSPAIALEGIDEFPIQGGDEGGFFVTLNENQASITLSVFEDGPGEGEEVLNFELADGELYEVANSSVDLTINSDTSEETAIVGLTLDPTFVSEEDEGASFTATFTVTNAEIPPVEFDADGNYVSGGLSILIDGTDITPIFDEITGGPILEGIEIGPFFDPEQPNLIEFILLQETSTGTLNIVNDVIEEENQDYTFTILNDENGLLSSNYIVNPDSASATVTLSDGNGGPGVGPTVGITATATELAEGDTVTLNFAVDGEIPAEGVDVLVQSPTPGAIGEFSIFDADGNFLIETTGLADFPISADGVGSSFVATITEPDASITLSVFDDGPDEGPEELEFSIINGEEYEVAADAGTVALSIDDGGTNLVDEAIFDFTWTGQIAGFSIEGQFSYDANASYADGIVREEDLLDFDISFFDPDGNLLRTYEDNHLTFPEFNFSYDIEAGEILQDGFFLADDGFNFGEKTAVGEDGFTGLNFWSRPEFNSQGEVPPPHLHIDDWSDEFGFPIGFSSHEDVAFFTRTTQQLLDTGRLGEAYIDEIQDSLDELGQRIEVTPAETPSELPVVSFSLTPEIVAEDSDSPTFAFTITIDGEIPEGGLPIILGGDFFPTPPNVYNDNIEAWPTDGSIEFTGPPVLDDDGNLIGFTVTLNESVVTANPFIFDDLLEEEPLTLTFSLLPSDDYIVGSDATVTFVDGDSVIPGSGPTVSLSVSETDLEEGDELTINFDVDGEIPDEGLQLFIDGGPTDLGEFNIFNEDGSPAIALDGINEFPLQGGAAGGFFVTLVENQASITLSVFEDGPGEGAETLNFELVDGEIYEVDEANSTVDLTINDTPEGTPIVSLSIDPAVVSEEDEGASFTATFTVTNGEIPEVEFDADGNYVSGGLSVFVDGGLDIINIFDEVTGAQILDGISLGSFFDPEQPGLVEFILLETTSTASLNIFNDVIEEADQEYTFTLLNDDDGLLGSTYAVNPDTAIGTVTLVDGNGGPGVGPTVSLSVSETDLEEGDEFTVNFSVDGEIPDGGLTVLVDSDTFAALGEFNVFDADGNPAFSTTGIEGIPVVGDTGASSFVVNITEPDASITLSVFDDGPNEGLEEFTFNVVNGEVYEVNADAGSVSFSIDDGGIIDGANILDTPFTRFQNSEIPGTYVYATGDEADSIRANQPGFIEEGVAFSAAIAPNDELIALNRLESNQLPGTFLYVGDEELASINADPNFSDAFTDQGVAFYVYGVGAGVETPFNRFQNTDVPGTYLFATGAEADAIRSDFPGFVDEGVAFEALI